ncbi:MAG: low molecular weight protein-tyrosine-phosphatase [Dermatophilaceae bacterium]
MPGRPVHVTFVCSGNICRSAMGQAILRKLVTDAGLGGDVRISSSGTGDWHVGEQADPRTIEVLAAHGYDGSTHRAREFDSSEFDDLDLVLAADEGHVRQLTRWARRPEHRTKIRLLREFDPAAVEAGTLETDDPWYRSNEHFLRCFREVEAACHGVLDHLQTGRD